MIQPTYQNKIIDVIQTVVRQTYNSYSLTYVSTLPCTFPKKENRYGWQYIADIMGDEMGDIKTFLETDSAINSEIETALLTVSDNQGKDMVLESIEVNQEILGDCDEEDDAATDDEDDGFATLSYAVLGLVILLPIIILIVACFIHSRYKGTDRPDYPSLFVFFSNLGDFWSDILFALHLNAVRSSLFIWAAMFTFIPYFFSVLLLVSFIYIVKTSKTNSKYMNIARYLHKYDYILIGLSLIGGLFPSLSILSSKLFHAEILSLDLRADQIATMAMFRFFNISFMENLPQLIIQIMFASSSLDSITVITMFFSTLSLLMGIITTISTCLGQRAATKKTPDVSKRLSHWLRTDTTLGDEADETKENETAVQNIKQDPIMLFDVKINCNSLRKHHKYTKLLLTNLISEHIEMDETCLELFGFNMNSTYDELQFYVEISLIKLMRFEQDLYKIKFSKTKNKMLALAKQNGNGTFIDKLIKKFKLSAVETKEIGIQCKYIDDAQNVELMRYNYHTFH